MKKLLLGLFLAFLPVPALADTAPLPDADPALWVVRDDDTTVYLFGTFHLLDGRRDWFNDEVRTAFDASDKLVLEAIIPDDPSSLQPLVMSRAIDREGPPLTERLSPEHAARLRAFFEGAGLPMAAVERFRPWFAAMTMANVAAQRLGLTGEHGPEKILTAAARERGIQIAELEGLEWQFDLFGNMSEEVSLQQLVSTIDRAEELESMLTPMLDAWSSGNTDGLVTMINAGLDEYPELYRLLFIERNASWAEWIARRMDEPGTVFLAVGAGHLAGRGSVQELLEARGLSVERVPSPRQ